MSEYTSRYDAVQVTYIDAQGNERQGWGVIDNDANELVNEGGGECENVKLACRLNRADKNVSK